VLAVAETKQATAPPAGHKRGAGPAPEGRRAAAPNHCGPAPLQRCSVAGCGCGGTCGGQTATSQAAGDATREQLAAPLQRRGALPLDGVLARAVQVRAGAPPGGTLARSSASSRGGSSQSSGGSSQSSGSSGGGGGGGGGGGSAGCKVDVRATHIGGILSGMPIWHLFVVTTDAGGTERYYRGGPGGPGGDPTFGTIITNDGPYVAGTIDWSPGAPSKTVLSGASACGKDACLAADLRRIDGTATSYAPTGPNSNTVAATILANCSIPQGKPVWIAPGWSDPAI
jgi:hypothetical protein